MAGIKFHGAVDTVISRNHIYRTCRGIWLDWMTQGTRVTGNLLHDNGPSEDLFVEVNHGPFLIDNNLFLSRISIFDMSEGGAYVHNLLGGSIRSRPEMGRSTPFLKSHSTEVAGLHKTLGGDSRYYNNILIGHNGLSAYDGAKLPMFMAGNVFLNGAQPSKHEPSPLVQADVDPDLKLVEQPDGVYVQITLDRAWAEQRREVVTTELLGKARIPGLPYEQPDGSAYRIDTDYLGRKRTDANPFPGPFELSERDRQELKVWPVATSDSPAGVR
jgi:alpha-N-arabinofuranosidase